MAIVGGEVLEVRPGVSQEVQTPSRSNTAVLLARRLRTYPAVRENRDPVRRSDHGHLGDGHNELSAAPAELALLSEDFIRKVPCQQQHVVGPPFQQRLGRQDWQVVARREAALLELTAVDNELDQPPIDAERIHQRAALGRSTIGRDPMPRVLQPLQQRQQLLLEARDPVGEIAIVAESQQTLGLFLRQQLGNVSRHLPALMRHEQPQRAAMDWKQFDVADHQTVASAERLDRTHRVIAKVLVIDRVELKLVDEVTDVWRFNDGDAIRLEHLLDSADKRIRIGNMGEYVVRVDDVSELPPCCETSGKSLVEELDEG